MKDRKGEVVRDREKVKVRKEEESLIVHEAVTMNNIILHDDINTKTDQESTLNAIDLPIMSCSCCLLFALCYVINK